MSIREEISMFSLVNQHRIVFDATDPEHVSAEAELERKLNRIVTQRAAKLVKDGRGEGEDIGPDREWTEEEQRHIECLQAYTNKCYPDSPARQAIQWALSRLESLSAPQAQKPAEPDHDPVTVEVVEVLRGFYQWSVDRWGEDFPATTKESPWRDLIYLLDRLGAIDGLIPHSTPTEAVAGTTVALKAKPDQPTPYHFQPYRVGMIDTVREDDPIGGRKVAFAGRTYAAVVSDAGRVFAVVQPPEDDLLLLPPGSFQVTEWAACAKEGGRS